MSREERKNKNGKLLKRTESGSHLLSTTERSRSKSMGAALSNIKENSEADNPYSLLSSQYAKEKHPKLKTLRKKDKQRSLSNEDIVKITQRDSNLFTRGSVSDLQVTPNPLKKVKITENNVAQLLEDVFLKKDGFDEKSCARTILGWLDDTDETITLLAKGLANLKKKISETKEKLSFHTLERLDGVLTELSYFDDKRIWLLLSIYSHEIDSEDSQQLAKTLYKRKHVTLERKRKKEREVHNDPLSELIINLMTAEIEKKSKGKAEDIEAIFRKDRLFIQISKLYLSALLKENLQKLEKNIQASIKNVTDTKNRKGKGSESIEVQSLLEETRSELPYDPKAFKAFSEEIIMGFFNTDLSYETRRFLDDLKKVLRKVTQLEEKDLNVLVIGSMLFLRGINSNLLGLYPNKDDVKYIVTINLIKTLQALTNETYFENQKEENEEYMMLHEICLNLREGYKSFLNRQWEPLAETSSNMSFSP